MSRSWREGLDGPSAPRYIRSKFKYVSEEQEVDKVYIIQNDWDDENGSGSEVVDGLFYETENAAWSDLKIIAEESYGKQLAVDDTSVTVRDAGNEYEVYFIVELTKG